MRLLSPHTSRESAAGGNCSRTAARSIRGCRSTIASSRSTGRSPTRSDTAMPVSGRPTASRCSRSTHIRTSSSPGVTGATGCAEWPPRWPTAQNVDPQHVVLLDTRLPPERDELTAHAVDQGQGARQLERVAFTSTEQSVVAEGYRGDVEDPHARLPSDPRMSRAAQRRLPLPLPPCRTGG